MTENEKELYIVQLEKSRVELHHILDNKIDQAILSIKNDEPFPETSPVLPLTTHPAQFKGMKPVAIIFKDRNKVSVKKWREVPIAILQECCRSPVFKQRLMDLRDKVNGRKRIILGKSPIGMNVPLQIDPELYMEGKFDTEWLLRVLTDMILRPIQYDFNGIHIVLRK